MDDDNDNDDNDGDDDNDGNDDNDDVQAGMNKLARENCRNDGPMGGGFIPPDTLKVGIVSIQYFPKILGSS